MEKGGRRRLLVFLVLFVPAVLVMAVVLLVALRRFEKENPAYRSTIQNRTLGQPAETASAQKTYEFVGRFTKVPQLTNQVVVGSFVLDGDSRRTPITVILGDPGDKVILGEYAPEKGTFSRDVTFNLVDNNQIVQRVRPNQPVLIGLKIPKYDPLDASSKFIQDAEDSAKSIQAFIEGKTSQIPEDLTFQITTIGVLK